MPVLKGFQYAAALGEPLMYHLNEIAALKRAVYEQILVPFTHRIIAVIVDSVGQPCRRAEEEQ